MSIEFKRAIPDVKMYPHYNSMINGPISNLGLLGAFAGVSIEVNSSGTEYEFYSFKNEVGSITLGGEEDWEIERNKRYSMVLAYDVVNYPLHAKADAMKELFRVSEEAFNLGDDRRSMISSRCLRRAYMMSALRSFAWTLYSYCKDNGNSPADVSSSELDELIEFIASCNWLNYNDKAMNGLCCGTDIHNYFLPDKVPENIKRQFLPDKKTIAEEKKRMADNPNYNPMLQEICSLDKLREDLAYIYPAILTIYEELKENRNYDEPLEGNAADVLFAWCSLAYSADGPFFVEDGPMSFWGDDSSDIDLSSDYEKVLYDGNVETNELTVTDLFPISASLEGTAYEGRNARIENVRVGDKLIFKADYNNSYYSPVAIEVFNSNNGSLGYIQQHYDYDSCIDLSNLELIARYKDELIATVESVTPLSARRKNAKYALMDIKFSPSGKKATTKTAQKGANSAPKTTSTTKKASTTKTDSTQGQEQIAVVNDTWEVTIPNGYIYCTDKSIIREHRDIIIMEDKKKNSFENPFGATESFTSKVKEMEDAAQCAPSYASLMLDSDNPVTVIRNTSDLYVAYTFLRTDKFEEDGKHNTLDIFKLMVGAGDYISVMQVFFNNSKKSHETQQLLVDKVARSIRLKGGSKSSLYDIDDSDEIEFSNHNTEVLDKAIEKLEASKMNGNDLTPEVAAEIQDILSEIDETEVTDELAVQIDAIKTQLGDLQEASSRMQNFQDKLKAEEQKRDEEHKKLMEERGSSEDSNEVTMYFSLLIEKSVGKIRRGQNDFYNCYSEDFPGLSKTELIELRKAIIPKMNDTDFVNRCNDAFSLFSFEYRYEILMLGSFNIALTGNPPEAKQHALNLCKEYFSEDELAEGSKLLDNEIANIRQTLVDNLSAADTNWLKFDTARESLRFNAEEKFKNYDSKNIFQFKRYDGCCYIVLSSGIYSAPINNFFPWFWGVSVTDIYDAANENPVNDMTDTIYGAGEFIAEEATEKAYKKYGNGKTPPSKDEYREPSATEKAAIKKLKDMVKLADGNKKLISDFYANAPVEFINAAEDLVDSLNSSSNDVIFKFKNQSDEVLLAYVRSNGVSQVNSLYNQFDELSREIKNVFAKYGLTGNSSTVSQNTSSTSSTSTNNNSSSGCCYVATCAYGSYDCPEVWTLRRFRDYVLAKTWYGRLFITLYYFFAPYLVKFFGDTEWFKSAWRKYLDKKVEKLNNEGFENTPYQDIDW